MDTNLLSVVCFANTSQEIAFSLWLHWLCYSDRIHVNVRAFSITRKKGTKGRISGASLAGYGGRRVHFLRLEPSLEAPHPTPIMPLASPIKSPRLLNPDVHK